MWYFQPVEEGMTELEEEKAKKTWYVDTPTQFIEDCKGKQKPSRYVIITRWWTEIDPRGFIRMFRKNGWYRSPDIRIYDRQQEDWLEGVERKEFIEDKLKPRLKKVLGINKLKDVVIRRYRFNFACQYTDGNLCDRDGHHQKMDNQTAAERLRPDLVGLYDYWLLATDDRPWNILPMTPEEHNQEHQRLKDTRFEFYRTLNQVNESYQWNQETGFSNSLEKTKPPPTER
jgi:hypothetical protein